LKHFFDSVADSLGRPVAGATVTVNVTGNGLASIYSDDGITLTSNPLTTNALGKFDFYVADGRYDLNISGTGFPAVTLSNIEIADITEQQESKGDLTWNTGAIIVTGSLALTQLIVTFSATPTFNATLSSSFKITLTANVTSSTLTNATAGQILTFQIVEDNVGGRTWTWPTNFKGAMTLTTTANAINTQIFYFDGTNAFALAPGTVN